MTTRVLPGISPDRTRAGSVSRLHSAGALIAALILGLLPGTVEAADPPGPPSAHSSAELLQTLAEVEAEASRLAPDRPLQTRTPQLALLLGSVYQGVTNVYSDDRSRFFAAQLFVINTTDAPQTLAVGSIRLRSGDQTISWQDRPPGIEGYSFQADNEHIAIREVQPPDALSIPAGGAASTWLLFAGLELGSFIPELKLEIPAQPSALLLDVNQFERAVLKLRTEKVGPANCLAILNISGAINTVNAGALADELDGLSQSGTHRVVLALDAEAPAPNQFLIDWLKQARKPNPYLHQFKQMPVFPVTMQELHLVLPQVNESERTETLHGDLNSAVSVALRSAFESVPPEEVVAAVRSPQPSVRAAALRYGASRLRPEQLPLILRQLDTEEPDVRSAAISALGEFAAPEAIARLSQLARAENPATATAAVRSLAGSRYPAAHAELSKLIDAGLSLPPQELVTILAGFPRPEWREAVLKFTTSSDTKVQQAAMQALARLGHSQLMDVLMQGLQSAEPRLREEAFLRLCDLETHAAEQLALDYALNRLKSEPPTGAMQQFLIRVRDQRAVPLLVPYLDGPEGIRRGVIELLAQIGDQSVAAEIANRYPKLTNSEKIVALQAMQTLDSPLGKPLALAALKSDDVGLIQRGVGYLQLDGGDDVVAAMADTLTSLRGNAANAGTHFICNGLGVIGSPAARRVLLEARRSKEDSTRQAAQQGLQVLWNQSPARELVALAEADLLIATRLTRPGLIPGAPGEQPETPEERQRMLQERLKSADEALAVAARVDPEFPELALQQGELHSLHGRTDEAITSFRRAIELNDMFTEAYVALGQALYAAERFEESLQPLEYAFEHDGTDRRHQWLTTRALAMIRLGRLEEAIALTRQHADKFPNEPVFEYNQACIYGRAIELLRKDPQVARDDPRITVFAEEAVRLLRESYQHDVSSATLEVDMLAFTREDPDLKPLHEFPEFRKLTELDLPSDQRRRPGQQPPAPEAPAAGELK